MPRKAPIKKQSISTLTSATPLKTVSFESGFHFYTTVGNYTGITATNLSEFASKLKIVPIESVIFHFRRKDFQNWVKNAIKDPALAERISAISGDQPAENLRNEILRVVESPPPQTSLSITQ